MVNPRWEWVKNESHFVLMTAVVIYVLGSIFAMDLPSNPDAFLSILAFMGPYFAFQVYQFPTFSADWEIPLVRTLVNILYLGSIALLSKLAEPELVQNPVISMLAFTNIFRLCENVPTTIAGIIRYRSQAKNAVNQEAADKPESCIN